MIKENIVLWTLLCLIIFRDVKYGPKYTRKVEGVNSREIKWQNWYNGIKNIMTII